MRIKANWEYERLKYCRIERTPEGLKYYSMLGGKKTEVTKDIYDVIEHSYHKEYLMDLERMSGKDVSLDQLAQDIENADKHGSVPMSLQSKSAEEQYFEQSDLESNHIPDMIAEEYSMLDTREKHLIHSFTKGSSCIKETAEKENVAEWTVYRHRKEVAAKVRESYQRRHGNNE